ncbi:MAG: SDR family oxidoreductase [Chlamydiales bacterium]|nr:SDR family oxidoreductase [Chlamydiales bacterium]
MKTGVILILGATSPIARALANYLAAKGNSLYLTSRDPEELRRIASDIKHRYDVKVWEASFDAEKLDTHTPFFQEVVRETGGLEGVVLAFGYLGEQSKASKDPSEAQKILNRNFLGAVSILDECANYFEAKGSGFIAGLSSVAGDRGRQSNYCYGTAKSALTTYLQGLRNRLYSSGVNVLTVKLGFVDTGMTFGKKGMFLVADPKEMGKKIGQAIEAKKDIVYLPWFWRYIMLIITCIPEKIFKRLKL